MLRDDIVICNADKGNAVVILDVEDYIKEANRQLGDTTFYKILSHDPTKLHAELVNGTIDNFKKERILDEKIANALKATDVKTSHFYLLPKIHKPNNPGRPVVSSINCHTSKISQFVDFHLQPFVQSMDSYLKDTTDFLNKLKDQRVQKNTILVTMDVKSLYTNIPNQEGIQAVKSVLEKSNKSSLTSVITSFLGLILTLNNFQFNDKNYLQINGASMGTKCSPTYANIFMSEFEKLFIYPKIKHKSQLYLRNIDDIFLLWTATEVELKVFIEEINKVHPQIKFDINYSYKQINFLDTTVTIENNSLVTSVFTKPTDRHSFLYQKSYHPRSTKNAIPFSQALRIKRICSKDDDYKEGITKLKQQFIERGYKEAELQVSLNKANCIAREDLLKYRKKPMNDNITFITTYNKSLPNIRKCIDENWYLLHINNQIATAFHTKPKISYKRNVNLRNLIGQYRISNNKKIVRKTIQTGKCSPCLSKRGNLCCSQIRNTSEFTNRKTGKLFKIFHNLNCKSSNVI